MDRLEFTFFGFPTIQRNHESVTIAERKAVALLAYLAVSGTIHGRDTLATLFWPMHDQQRARANLRYVLWLIRQQLGEGWLVVDRESVRLAEGSAVTSDVARFLTLCQTAEGDRPNGAEQRESMHAAVALYQGEFLAGFTLEECPEFDDWQRSQGEELRRKVAALLEQLVGLHRAAGEVETAIGYARQWLALDPLHEAVHCHLMELLVEAGEVAAALRQYDECARLLETELNLSPAPETTARYEAIRARTPQPPVTTASPRQPSATLLRQRTPTTHNLPHQSTRFIGRVGELAQLAARLGNDECRLLTIVGAGGVGKTRLGLQAAAMQVGAFAHGVYFVALEGVEKAELVAATILDALDVPRTGDVASQPYLLRYLRDKELLLLLDNFEHLADATELIVEMLRAAPGVKLLITSRERLQLREEWLLSLTGLQTPAADDPHFDIAQWEVTQWEQFEALQFFAQCARRVTPDFHFNRQTAPTYVKICQLVDGMPLAIELAAAWLRLLSVEEIAAEIRQRLDFLATNLRDIPARHRSMRVVFDRSWQMLTDEERATLSQLAVFQGSFTRAAAESVAGASVRQLSALLDKSWLRPLPNSRYHLHSLVRQYCIEQWATTGNDATIGVEGLRDRHSAYYAAFVQAQEAKLLGREQGEAVAAILAEMDNVWAAWHFATDHLPDHAYVLRVNQFLEGFSFVVRARGLFHEMRDALLLALTRMQDLPLSDEISMVRARLLLYLGWFGIDPGLLDEAIAHCEQARDLLRGLPPSPAQVAEYRFATLGLGWAHYNAGRYAEAGPCYHEVLRACDQETVSWHRAMARMYLALNALRQGQLAEAETWTTASLEDCESLGFLAHISANLRIAAQIARLRGDHVRAQTLLTRALDCAISSGLHKHVCHTLLDLGMLAAVQTDYDAARTYYEQGFALAREIGDRLAEAALRGGMAEVALARGNLDEAEALFITNMALCEEIGRRRDAMLARHGLGKVALAQGKVDLARDQFRHALEMALALRATPDALQVLVGMARVLRAAGEEGQAVRLLHYVTHHEATTAQSRQDATHLLEESTLDEITVAQRTPSTANGAAARPTLEQVVAEFKLATQ